MDVTVRLFASLRWGRPEEQVICCTPCSTVGKAIQDLGIPPDQVSIILVNGKQVDANHRLSAGDVLSLFPLLGGG
jgi:sulfur-carrier protein